MLCVLGHVWAERLLRAGAGGERSSGCIPGRGKVKRLMWAGAGVTRRLRCCRLRPREAGKGGTAWGARTRWLRGVLERGQSGLPASRRVRVLAARPVGERRALRVGGGFWYTLHGSRRGAP